MDYSSPGSSVHGLFQARILEWIAISSSRGSSWPRNQTRLSCSACTGRRILYSWSIWEAIQPFFGRGKKTQQCILRGPVNKTRLVGQMWKWKTIQKACPFPHTCLCLMGYLWPLLPYALNVYTVHCFLTSKMLFWHVQQSWLDNCADCGWVSSDFKGVRDGTVRFRKELFFLPASLVEADLSHQN